MTDDCIEIYSFKQMEKLAILIANPQSSNSVME